VLSPKSKVQSACVSLCMRVRLGSVQLRWDCRPSRRRHRHRNMACFHASPLSSQLVCVVACTDRPHGGPGTSPGPGAGVVRVRCGHESCAPIATAGGTVAQAAVGEQWCVLEGCGSGGQCCIVQRTTALLHRIDADVRIRKRPLMVPPTGPTTTQRERTETGG